MPRYSPRFSPHSRSKGLHGLLKDINQRAKFRTTQRLRRNSLYPSLQSNTHYPTPSEQSVSFLTKTFRLFLALLLFPLCLPASQALLHAQFAPGRSWWWLINQPTTWCFLGGAALMLFFFCLPSLRARLLYIYVLGHELTHVFFIWLFGGHIAGFSCQTHGGYVLTNKSNLLIALSPYFIPFWCTLIVIYFGCWQLLVKLHLVGPIPAHFFLLYACVGFFWTFHFLWTLWMLPCDQPDLRENGIFLSLVVIYLSSILFLSLLLFFLVDSFNLLEWIKSFWHYTQTFFHLLFLASQKAYHLIFSSLLSLALH